MHYSARNGSHNLITYFIDIGTNIYLKTNNGSNYLHIAALYGHLTLFKKLIDKDDFYVNVADKDVWTILHYSARNGSYNCLNILLIKRLILT